MTNKRNIVIYSIIGAVVLALVIFLLVNKKTDAPVVNVDEETPSSVVEETGSNSTTVDVVKSVPSISYKDALIKYKDARIQLDDRCQATPNNVTYKNNTSIMIDNRSSATRSVKVDTTYSIKAYGFKIIKLSSASLPKTLLVDCDKFQNVATILVQK